MENPLNTFRDLKRQEAHMVLFAFIGLISPGIISIWFYQPNLIQEINAFSLILLSLSATFPIAALNYLIISFGVKKSDDDIVLFMSAMLIIGLTVIVLGSINIFSLMPFKLYILVGSILNILLSLFMRQVAKILPDQENESAS